MRGISLSLKIFQYVHPNGDVLPLEIWMKFGIELAHFLKMQPEFVKVYVSVPSSLLFSYVFTLGCIDYDFQHPIKERLLEKYLLLQPGQRVLYKVDDEWIAHSVEKVGEHPISKARALILRGRMNSINYVPEERWSTHVSIYDEEITDIRNIRKVKNVFNILEDALLDTLYEEGKLQLVMMQNTPNTYVYTNKTEWNIYKETITLYLKKQLVGLDNFFFDGSLTTFRNIGFLEHKAIDVVSPDATIILNGSSRALRKLDLFKEKRCAIIVDRHELKEKFEELQFKIEQDCLTGKNTIINDRLIEYLQQRNTNIPEGVEIIVWIP